MIVLYFNLSSKFYDFLPLCQGINFNIWAMIHIAISIMICRKIFSHQHQRKNGQVKTHSPIYCIKDDRGSWLESDIWTFTHCLGLGHETMVCAVCLFVFLWICHMAGLLRGTFVSWWYLFRIWHSVTDMQHYYHARYPTDDWHLAYMFSLVYVSVEVCLVGVFSHSVSTRRDPCVRVYAPLTLVSPLTRKQNSNRGDPALFDPSEWAFEFTYGSACIIGW